MSRPALRLLLIFFAVALFALEVAPLFAPDDPAAPAVESSSVGVSYHMIQVGNWLAIETESSDRTWSPEQVVITSALVPIVTPTANGQWTIRFSPP